MSRARNLKRGAGTHSPVLTGLQGQSPSVAQGVVETNNIDPEAAWHGLDGIQNAFHLTGDMQQQTS